MNLPTHEELIATRGPVFKAANPTISVEIRNQAIRLCTFAHVNEYFGIYDFGRACTEEDVDPHVLTGSAELARLALWTIPTGSVEAFTWWLKAADMLRSGWSP